VRKLLLAAFALMQGVAMAQPASVLYLTHSAGFRHDSLPLSQQVLRDLGTRSGRFSVTATENLSALDDLNRYKAVVFFTSGELALSDRQKEALLEFVRDGGGFAGIHSGTDTLYTWPEYGELIGGRFDGHPWTQEVRIDVEDPDHPAVRHLESSFAITDEIYQFREFSRSRVRVLMTLDTTSVDMRAAGINRTDDDFALAWTRLYGNGRVFYTALGHFDSTWRNARFQTMLEEAILWITGQREGEGAPRPPVVSSIAQGGIGNAATMEPRMTISPGSFVSLFGSNLTAGSTMAGDVRSAPLSLAGTQVRIGGRAIPIVYASPGQINLLTPPDLDAGQEVEVVTRAAGSAPVSSRVAVRSATPGIFVVTAAGDRHVTLWATGLGAVTRRGDLDWTTATPTVKVNGVEARVLFSGLAPGWPGLYQVNVELPESVQRIVAFELSVP
jgi:uncharacterized protein